MRMRALFLLAMGLSLSGCLMNWYHPFISEHTRATKKAAADAGDPAALYAMGDSYCCGPKGGYYDTEKAMAYWCRAAKMGHGPSMLALGKLYEDSYRMIDNTIPKNDLKAYMWYSAAAQSGVSEAAELVRSQEQVMTPANLAKAKAMVPHWRETRCVLLSPPEGPWDPAWVKAQEDAKHQVEYEATHPDFAQPQPANTERRRR